MVVRQGWILLRIVLVVGVEVTGHRTQEINNMAGGQKSRIRGGNSVLWTEQKERAHLKQSVN